MAETVLSRYSGFIPHDHVKTRYGWADISQYVGGWNGGCGVLIIARRWTVTNNSTAIALVTGIQKNANYYSIDVRRDTSGPNISFANNSSTIIRIDFLDEAGGFYAIMPLFICPNRG